MDFIYDLIGRFHPLIVHLPIGFIIIGLMLDFCFRDKTEFSPVLRFVFLWAFITSFFSIITGYLQYEREGFAWENVKSHFIMGIVSMVFCLFFFLNLKYEKFKIIPKNVLFVLLAFSLLITGHLGGTITHGSYHLTEPLPTGLKEVLGLESNYKLIELDPDNYKNANFYVDVIQPIFNQKCVSCHNDKKSKGGLNMINFNSIMTGGENGPVIYINNSLESEIYKRITLPLLDRYHMPPKSKIQPTQDEINLIKLWINNSASQNTLIKDLPIPKKLLASFFPNKPNGIFPINNIPFVKNEILSELRQKGFVVTRIFESSPFLKVSCINYPDFKDNSITELKKIEKNIVELDLSKTQITDNVFDHIVKFNNLTILKLNETNITGLMIDKLSVLPNLKKLSLINTSFDFNYISKFYDFPNLNMVNIYDYEELKLKALNLPDSLKSIFNIGRLKLNKVKTDSIIYPFKVYGE